MFAEQSLASGVYQNATDIDLFTNTTNVSNNPSIMNYLLLRKYENDCQDILITLFYSGLSDPDFL